MRGLWKARIQGQGEWYSVLALSSVAFNLPQQPEPFPDGFSLQDDSWSHEYWILPASTGKRGRGTKLLGKPGLGP